MLLGQDIYFLLLTENPLKVELGDTVYDPKFVTYNQSPILSS
jgi:hypothetical protein